jgi:hypothetical protein
MLEKTFSFRLSPENFKELMLLLDPLHTNYITYKDFLDLFEHREPLVSASVACDILLIIHISGRLVLCCSTMKASVSYLYVSILYTQREASLGTGWFQRSRWKSLEFFLSFDILPMNFMKLEGIAYSQPGGANQSTCLLTRIEIFLWRWNRFHLHC